MSNDRYHGDDAGSGVASLAHLKTIANSGPVVAEERLRDFLRAQPALADTTIEVRLPEEQVAAGASGGTLMFEIVASDLPQWSGRYVLRYELGDGNFFSQTSLASQAETMRALRRRGMPVPDATWFDPDGLIVPGKASLIMRRIEARAPNIQYLQTGPYVEADAAVRRRMLEELMGFAARLHALPVSELGLSMLQDRSGTGEHFLVQEIDWALAELLARFPEREEGPRAALHHELRSTLLSAADRLKAALPQEVEPVLVHGDVTLANTMFNANGTIAAVLDWELAHLGLPAEDPSYTHHALRSIAAMGEVAVPVPSMGEIVGAYEAAGGTLEHFRFASALSAYRIAIWGAIGMRRMPEPFWPAQRTVWQAQGGIVAETLAALEAE